MSSLTEESPTTKTRVKSDSRLAHHSSFLTRTKAFQKLSKHAYKKLADKNNGKIGKKEVYAGLLLIHLKLAKYAGPAACNPPEQSTVEAMVDAADDDKSGTIDEEEFMQIMMACCMDITFRLVVYIVLLVFLVPSITDLFGSLFLQLDQKVGYQMSKSDSNMVTMVPWEKLNKVIIKSSLSMIVIPYLFDWIDFRSQKLAEDIEITQIDSDKKTS